MTPAIYRPITILFIILLIQQLSGCYVVIFYAISVFRNVGAEFGDYLNEYGALVLLGVIRFVISVLTAFLSRTIGRRVLCIVSGIGMSFSMFLASIYLFISSHYGVGSEIIAILDKYNWILLIVVLLYVCMSSLGFAVIPWTLIGELLPISFRGVGGGLMISIAYGMMFGVIKSYPYAVINIGVKNVFLFFAFVSFIGTAFVYLFLPETLGKSFADVERYFAGQNSTLENDDKNISDV